MKKLLSTKLHVNMVVTSFMFYWTAFTIFYLLAFFYMLYRLWNGHDVTPHEVAGGYLYYKAEEWTGFRKKRKLLFNKQIFARY